MAILRRGALVTIITMVVLAIPAASSAPATSSADLKVQIKRVRAGLNTVGKNLSAAERDLSFTDAAVAKHRTALADARVRHGILRSAISRRAAEMYRTADTGALQLLASGTELDTVLDRMSYLEQLRRGETEMLEEVEALRRTATAESEALRTARDQAARLRTDLANQQRALQSKLQDLERLSSFLGSRTSARGSRSGGRGLVCPVIGLQYVSNNYGDPRPGGPHTGVDISAHHGRPAVAALPGTIVDTPYGGWIGIGIILRDLVGNEWWYAHLSSENVRVGQRVAAGEYIGRVGCTGTCYGAHLHFEYHPGGGGPSNPYSFVSAAC